MEGMENSASEVLFFFFCSEIRILFILGLLWELPAFSSLEQLLPSEHCLGECPSTIKDGDYLDKVDNLVFLRAQTEQTFMQY